MFEKLELERIVANDGQIMTSRKLNKVARNG
jgi:hypothetical protein